MLSVGIDSVDIERCRAWHTFSPKKLARLFSEEEIAYCLSDAHRAAERFAVRFAAKEAFYKAVSVLSTKPLPFLTVVRATAVTKNTDGLPLLKVSWDMLAVTPYTTHISLTHTTTVATAIVILSQ